MHDSAELSQMMNDFTRYSMLPSLKFSPEVGTYVSYDIIAYDFFHRNTLDVVSDITTDRDLALSICYRFNKYQLSPIHLEDAILDIIS